MKQIENIKKSQTKLLEMKSTIFERKTHWVGLTTQGKWQEKEWGLGDTAVNSPE